MITALGFMLINLVSYILAFARGPFWGLFAYLNIYFIAPNSVLYWWVDYLPFKRWSLLTSLVLVLSLFIHKDKISSHKFANTIWVYVFLALSMVITFTSAIDQKNSLENLYLLFTYSLIVYIMLRSLKDESQMRLYLLAIVAFTALLSLNAYLNGERINSRLEMAGAADAFTSNQFSLLLAAIIPLIFVFLKDGNRYERIIALGSLPFILNAFILSNSRGSTIALAGGLIVAGLIVADNQIRKGLVILLVALVPVFLYLSDADYLERLSSLLEYSAAIEDESQARELSSGRTEIWGYGLEMARDYPFGAGPDGFKKLARFYMPEEILTFRKGAQYGVRAAHNTYLQVTVEQGIIGIIIWLIMCLHTSRILARSFKVVSKLKTPKPFWRHAIFAMNVSFYSILIGGLVNSRIYYEYFWWQLAMSAIVYSLVNQMVKQETEKGNAGLKSVAIVSHDDAVSQN